MLQEALVRNVAVVCCSKPAPKWGFASLPVTGPGDGSPFFRYSRIFGKTSCPEGKAILSGLLVCASRL